MRALSLIASIGLLVTLASTVQAHENCIADVIYSSRHIRMRKRATEFGYDGETGPAQWANLDSNFSTCATGKSQSPIDFEGDTFLAASIPVEFNWVTWTNAEFLNEGTTVKVIAPNNDSTTTRLSDGQVFTLKQFHIHTPSEHRLDGQSTSAELHFVHQDEAGNILVTGVLLDVNSESTNNTFLNQLTAKLPVGEKETKTELEEVSFDSILSLITAGSFNTYSGSLTTPPCSEGLSWVVTSSPISMSLEQLKDFETVVTFNARFVQAINGRTGSSNSSASTSTVTVTETVTEAAIASESATEAAAASESGTGATETTGAAETGAAETEGSTSTSTRSRRSRSRSRSRRRRIRSSSTTEAASTEA